MISEHSNSQYSADPVQFIFARANFRPRNLWGCKNYHKFDAYKETKTNATDEAVRTCHYVPCTDDERFNHKNCSFVSTKMDSGDEGEQRLGEESCCLIFTIVSCSKATSAAGGEPPINSQSDDRDLEGATRPSSIPPPQCRVALLNTSRNSVSRSDYWSMTGSSPTASTNFRWPTDGAEWNSTCFLPTITYIKQTSGSS
jgi:hypothetical protein